MNRNRTRKAIEQVQRLYRRLEWLPPLVARALIAVIFIRTGYGKLTHFHQIVGYFRDDLHIPAPALNAALASSAELGCGILLAIGLLTRLAAWPLVLTMIVAIATARVPGFHDYAAGAAAHSGVGGAGAFIDYFLAEHGQEVHYIVLLLYLAVFGAGALSLDHLLGRRLAPSGSARGEGERSGAG